MSVIQETCDDTYSKKRNWKSHTCSGAMNLQKKWISSTKSTHQEWRNEITVQLSRYFGF